MPATTVFTARRVITMDATAPEATAVAVSGGQITAVGSIDDLRALQARAAMLGQRSAGASASDDVEEAAELLAAQFRVAKAATARAVCAALAAPSGTKQ